VSRGSRWRRRLASAQHADPSCAAASSRIRSEGDPSSAHAAQALSAISPSAKLVIELALGPTNHQCSSPRGEQPAQAIRGVAPRSAAMARSSVTMGRPWRDRWREVHWVVRPRRRAAPVSPLITCRQVAPASGPNIRHPCSCATLRSRAPRRARRVNSALIAGSARLGCGDGVRRSSARAEIARAHVAHLALAHQASSARRVSPAARARRGRAVAAVEWSRPSLQAGLHRARMCERPSHVVGAGPVRRRTLVPPACALANPAPSCLAPRCSDCPASRHGVSMRFTPRSTPNATSVSSAHGPAQRWIARFRAAPKSWRRVQARDAQAGTAEGAIATGVRSCAQTQADRCTNRVQMPVRSTDARVVERSN